MWRKTNWNETYEIHGSFLIPVILGPRHFNEEDWAKVRSTVVGGRACLFGSACTEIEIRSSAELGNGGCRPQLISALCSTQINLEVLPPTKPLLPLVMATTAFAPGGPFF